ncbi:unnamed protein product, partial [Prorocentrum cordatum]
GPKSFCAAVDAATRARCPIDEGVPFGAAKSELAWPEGDAQRFAILEAGLAGSKNAHQAADASAQAALFAILEAGLAGSKNAHQAADASAQ